MRLQFTFIFFLFCFLSHFFFVVSSTPISDLPNRGQHSRRIEGNRTTEEYGEKMKLLSETCTKKMASVFTSAAFTFLLGLTIPAAAQHYNRIDLTTDQTAAPPPMLADTPTINPDPNLLDRKSTPLNSSHIPL